MCLGMWFSSRAVNIENRKLNTQSAQDTLRQYKSNQYKSYCIGNLKGI